MNQFTPETASRLTESHIQLSHGRKAALLRVTGEAAALRDYRRKDGNIRIVTRFLFVPRCHLLSRYSLPSACVSVQMSVRTCTCVVSYPVDCHCAASPWRTPGCRRWRCAADGAGASWRSPCTGAGRSACCGRWGGGRSSWRALKCKKRENNCHNYKPKKIKIKNSTPKWKKFNILVFPPTPCSVLFLWGTPCVVKLCLC